MATPAPSFPHSQRPIAAGTVVDLSDSHKHTQSKGRMVEEPSRSRELPVEIDSEETRDSSPFQRSRESPASAESAIEMTSQDHEDDNLYEVDDAQGLQEMQEMQDMRIGDHDDSNKEFRLHRLPETIIKEDTRQPIPGSSKATGFDRSSALSRSGESSSAAAGRRGLRMVSDPLVRDNNEHTSKRDSLSTVYPPRSSRSSSPVSANEMYLEAAERARSTSKNYGMNVDSHPATPTRANERRLSQSSLSTKSPSSTTGTSTPSVQDLPGWSSSLETPTRHTGSVKMTSSPSDGTRRSLQGLSPVLSCDGLPETTGVVGRSSSMETPPTVQRTYMYSQHGKPISEDILDQLRGNPRSTSTQNAKDQSALSQDTIGSLSGFSLIDEDEYNEQGLESSRTNDVESISMRGVTMDNATQEMLEMNDKPKDGLETTGIGLEPWVLISSTEREHSIHTENRQDVREEGDGYHDQYGMGATQDDPAVSSTTAAGSTTKQTLTGFKTEKGNPLAASKAARERMEELFAEGDMETQSFSIGVSSAAPQQPASAEDVSPSKNSGLDKSHAGKCILHPNAHITSTAIAQPPSVTHAPGYMSLFHLPVQGQRSSLRDTFGCPRPIEHEELLGLGVPKAAIDMTLDDAKAYRFGNWGLEDAKRDLIARGAVPSRFSNAWLSNHYGLIVWKLACYLRSWPHYFLSQILSWFCPAGVLNQLAYRYEREINLDERPALRRIVEGDESAGRHMVLCIASVAKEYSDKAKGEVLKVTVTDGWYVLPAVLDPCLTRAVEGERLKIGSKVHVCGAKLSGAENGVPILAPAGVGATTTSVSIVLQANGTRLAAWDTKLGFQRSPMIWTTQIRSISADGGLVPGLDVVVLRKYPVVFVETLKDGMTKIMRTEREEHRAIVAHLEPFSKRYHDMVEEVEGKYGEGTSSSGMRDEIRARADELEAQVPARNVVSLFTIRVGIYGSTAYGACDENGRWQEALVTFWNQDRTLYQDRALYKDHALYQEGHRFRITSLMAKRTSREPGFEDMIHLSSTRTTTAQEMATNPVVMANTNYRPRAVTSCAEIEYLFPGAEIDLAVIILAVSNRIAGSNRIFMVVTDNSQQLTVVEHQVSADQTLPISLKVHARMLMANARHKAQDFELRVPVVMSLQGYTNITVVSSPSANLSGVPKWLSYAQPSLQKLSELVGGSRRQGEMEEGSVVDLTARGNDMLKKILA
ncbi:MAG: BRCA2, oligonucleotide/oligosaccharide-binding, domain 1-domain-containing protein [Benniella sp.]|nr:MAG: BRCA2, oligonucleotide/oligosaccharide-binding, domain 1-domain-containing protein [Benniella sp.]